MSKKAKVWRMTLIVILQIMTISVAIATMHLMFSETYSFVGKVVFVPGAVAVTMLMAFVVWAAANAEYEEDDDGDVSVNFTMRVK